MRTIEFRGKRLAGNNWVYDWVYGSLVLAKNGVFILQPHHPDYLLQEIEPETVEIKTDNKEFVNVNIVKILKQGE